MVRSMRGTSIAALVVAALGSAAIAAPPYSEDFSGGVSGWQFTTNNVVPLVSVGSGGAVDNGAFIRNNLPTLVGSPQAPSTALLFRAHKTYAGINTDYTGDWMATGVEEVRAWVRHNAPEPLPFVGRFATQFNFPAVFYTKSPLVQPNVWTELVFDTSLSSPDLTAYEGGTFQNVYQGFDNSGVGNMQFGVSIPNNLLNSGPYVFDFDNVSIVTPEPASAALAALALGGLGLLARRRFSLLGA